MTEQLLHKVSAWIDHFVAVFGHFGIFLAMLIESCNIPLPSEITMPLGGYYASQGKLSFWGVIIAGVLGNVVGAWLSYFIGMYGGRAFLIRYGKYILFSEKHLDTADRWFERFGEGTVFFGRLLPFIRTFISLPAGISRMQFGKFTLFTLIGSLPWCWLFTWIGFTFGENMGKLKPIFHDLDYVMVAVLIALIAYFWMKGSKKKSL